MKSYYKTLAICYALILTSCTPATQTKLANLGLAPPPAYQEPLTSDVAYLTIDRSESANSISSYTTWFFNNSYDCSGPMRVPNLSNWTSRDFNRPSAKLLPNKQLTFAVNYNSFMEYCSFIASFTPQAQKNYKLLLDLNVNKCHILLVKIDKNGITPVKITVRKQNNSITTMFYTSSYCLPEDSAISENSKS